MSRSNGMPVRFILGVGSGRTGTGSLAELLDKQPGVSCTHEGLFIPWEKDLIAYYQALIKLVNNATEPIIGNVAFYWKNYLSEVFRDLVDPKIIVLKRKRQEVIESFSALYYGKNHWSSREEDNWDGRDPGMQILSAMFPKYDLSKEEAIGQYWDEYYADMDFWMDKFPDNMMLVDMYDLKDKATQRRILKFIGIPTRNMVFDDSIHKHKRTDRKKGGMLFVNGPPPKELEDMAMNKALFGVSAMKLAGLPTDFELDLTDEEFAQIKEHPDVKNMLEKEATLEKLG